MLIKTTTELLKVTDVVTAVKIAEVTTTINFIENNILKKILGSDLYRELNDSYNEEGEMEDEMKELLSYCQKVIGPYVCYYYLPKASVQLSGAGAQRTEGTTNKSTFAYQDANFREQNLFEGESACEDLLEYLNENSSDFSSWSDSEEFEEYNSLFVKSGREFNKHYSTSQPFRNYWAMRFKMVEVELLTIRKQLTPALYDALKTKFNDAEADLSGEEKALILYIKKAICFLTVASAVPHINVRIDDKGITVVSDSTGGVNDKDKSKAADDARVSNLISSCYDAGTRWLTEAMVYVKDNAEAFPDWKAPEKQCLSKTNNNKLGGAYGLL